jgi:tryptophan synthase alpha chain
VLILPLVYPATVRDLGLPALLDGASGAGTDGVVLVEPRADELRAATAAGLGAIPVIRPSATPEEVAALEACAPHLTYRTLAAGTGATLDIDDARRAARAMQATAQRPFMVGFGIRRDTEIRALAPHVTGIVIGSELIRLLRDLPAPERVSFMTRTVAAWKAAATLP